MSLLLVTLRKDLLLQWRQRGHLVAVMAFGCTALLLFSFAVGPDARALRQHAAGFLWLALLLSSTLALGDSFHAESEHGALEGLLLLPAPAVALYYGKALANTVQLTLVGVALLPLTVVLYDAGTSRVFALAGLILLGASALSAPGTLYAALTAAAGARATLLPLLLFPLVVPVLLGAVKATSLLILGDPMGQLEGWVLLLASFNLIHWSLGGLLFARVVED